MIKSFGKLDLEEKMGRAKLMQNTEEKTKQRT